MAPNVERAILFNRNLLGISNTFMRGREALEHTLPDLEPLINGKREIVVIPYALHNMDMVLEKMGDVFKKMGGKSVMSPHQYPGQEKAIIADADVVYIGGGNTGRLVANLHGLRNADGSLVDQRPRASTSSLVEAIREKSARGFAIVGSSAGLNVMCQDVRCTNDMQAAVQVQADGSSVLRVDALGLLPKHLGLNPHYQDKVAITDEQRENILDIAPEVAQLIDHQGEPRDERLAQILEMDQDRIVLALREGAYIVVRGEHMDFKGETGGVIFEWGRGAQIVSPDTDLSHLLTNKQ